MKFVCSPEYIDSLAQAKVIEADDAQAAAIQFNKDLNDKAEKEHQDRQSQRATRRSKKGSPRAISTSPFKRKNNPIVVLNVETGEVREFSPKPPPPPPPEQWEWKSRQLNEKNFEDDDWDDDDDEEDEDDAA